MADAVASVAQRLREARKRYSEQKHAFAPIRARFLELTAEQDRLRRQVRRLHRRARLYRTLTRWIFPNGWVTIGSAAAAGAAVHVALGRGFEWPAAVLVSMVAGAASAAAIGWWFSRAQHASEELRDTERQLEVVRTALQGLTPLYQQRQQAVREAEAAVRDLEAALGREVAELLATPWQQLAGRSFERFLQRAFQVHGYRAELTTAARDQGVDLIVWTPDGRKIAVEAKGYPAGGSVGNDVVLKVVGGAQYYNCAGAVVITNSRFTADARQAAQRTGCVLIDRESMESFLQGAIRL